MTGVWRIRIDVGGTFTDCVATDPTGAVHVAKVLSSGAVRARIGSMSGARIGLQAGAGLPGLVGARARLVGGDDATTIVSADPENGAVELESFQQAWRPGAAIEITTGEPAPILAARVITDVPVGRSLPPCEFRLATTRATNALLTREYASAALFVTEGFSDLLRIGNQQRPDIYARSVVKRPPVTELVYDVPGRLASDGTVVTPLDEPALRSAAQQARASGAETAAVVLINAWADDSQERRACEILREAGFGTVIASSHLVPRIGLLDRAQASAIEASLEPVLGGYLREVSEPIPDGEFAVLSSTGGLMKSGSFCPIDGLLSGPAGGVVGAAAVGQRCGMPRLISFDMGGTSTDVARLDHGHTISPTHTVGGHRIGRPSVAIETVAAGGGSICEIRDGRLAVGPRSAGADPGPACYGAGGPLTVTDVNLLTGRIDEGAFEIPIDRAAADRAAEVIALAANNAGLRIERDELLAGLLDLADEKMAEAIRGVSIRRGYDPADHAMVAFGGAGPQHACEVAARLGIRRALIPQHASLLSAVGLDAARPEAIAERTLLVPLDDDHDALARAFEELADRAATDLGTPHNEQTRLARVRLIGQEQTIDIDASDLAQLASRFSEAYQREHAIVPTRPAEVVSIAVIARGERPKELAFDAETCDETSGALRTRRVLDAAGWVDAALVQRAALAVGKPAHGPAVISEPRTQTWIPAGWSGKLTDDGTIVLTHAGEPVSVERRDEVAREIIVHRLAAIATQMGDALERAAVSVNVKDRRDYSCSIHDTEGRLVSSADHMPVHLGAMGACVQGVLEYLGPLEAGQAALTNHPGFGGSHLPDLTVIQPVFAGAGDRLGYVASRAHHAEVGGMTPGSMPPGAKSLADEGVPIRPVLIAEAGVLLEDRVRSIFREHRWPSRAVDDNVADLGAAISAGTRAAALIAELESAEGAKRLSDAMAWIRGHTAALVRERLAQIAGVNERVVESLDGGAEIRAHLTIDDSGSMEIDLTGTSPTQASNINAPLAVSRSAIAYVLRLVLDHPITLNDGFLEPVRIIVPEGCFLNPNFQTEDDRCPAVAGGNVETSQRLTECLLRALRLTAGGAGTMNNTLIGNTQFGVYETLGSGCGAAPDREGANAVHQHMSNTAITDAEILEQRYPLRVRRFEIRKGSGGAGRTRGGDGITREIEALTPVTVSVVTQRRAAGAPGIDGGEAGQRGANTVLRAGGPAESLRWADTTELASGDRIRMETPGGGGWEPPAERP